MATTTTKTNKPILPRGLDNRPVDSYNRAELYSGKALDFDGVNDYVDVPYLDSLANTGVSSTFSFYFNVDTITGSIVFAEQRKAASKRYVVWYDHANTRLQLYLNSVSSVINFPLTETNQWFYFTGVVDGSTAKMYINGELIGSTSYAPFESNVDFYLGTYDGASGYFYNGKMSNAKIFNTALTATQVADLYNNPEKVVPTGVANTALKLFLPMQEGAGTTAYDGSGNGNHGTISGATYTHGIGAPVAQTAVIDWNKGVNLLAYSEALNTSNYFNGLRILFESNKSAPNGSADAMRLKLSATVTNTIAYIIRGGISGYAGQTISAFLKADEITEVLLFSNGGAGIYFDIEDGSFISYFQTSANIDSYNIEDFGGGWRRYSITFNTAVNDIQILFAKNGDITADYTINEGLEIFGVCVGSVNYTPTFGTAQTSPVLLPQGLTTGRDITGVNLFENVRKQGALNLDGNSWAEVHDNESLDFGTGEFTLEAWVRAKYVNTGSALNVVLNLGGNASTAGAVSMLVGSTNKVTAVYNNSYIDSNTILTEGEWYHLVVNFNGTHSQIYVNGAFDKNIARTAADISNALVKEIGRDSTTARTYKDQIAQPRIYNRALTAAEVLNNYNATKTLYI